MTFLRQNENEAEDVFYVYSFYDSGFHSDSEIVAGPFFTEKAALDTCEKLIEGEMAKSSLCIFWEKVYEVVNVRRRFKLVEKNFGRDRTVKELEIGH